jgi:hypothetical protein
MLKTDCICKVLIYSLFLARARSRSTEVVVRTRPAALRTGSVPQDWRTPLSEVKSRTYLASLRQLETSYAMFSVNLDEALGFRRGGRIAKAYQVLSVSPALCHRLTDPMAILLRSMSVHAKHFGTAPNLAPLDPANFQCSRNQRTARFNGIFSKILLSRRSQFLHKISALTELVETLASSFLTAAEELAEGTSTEPDHDWEILDATHYDLNTCFREIAVLLKSFLHALPEGQIQAFQATLQKQNLASRGSELPSQRHLVHRRMTLIKGQ